MIWRDGEGKRPWRVRLRIDGRDTLRSFPTKKLAEEYERSVKESRARAAAGMPTEQGPITYQALVDLYLTNYTERSKPWLERMLKHSTAKFGHVQVRHLRGEQIGRWLHNDLDLAPKTRLHILTAMRQVLEVGVEWGYLSRSPAKAVRPPQGASKPPEVYPLESWQEVLAVADACGHYGPLVRFACATGLRPGEWAALQWRDVNIGERVLRVARTTTGDAGKTPGALRPVALSQPAIRAFRELPRSLDRTALVFTTPRSKRIDPSNFATYIWRPALELCGLQKRPPYQMRHTYATLALASGVTIEWISKQMGHANIGITLKFYARFVRAVDDRMLAFLDRMEAEDGRNDGTQERTDRPR